MGEEGDEKAVGRRKGGAAWHGKQEWEGRK